MKFMKGSVLLFTVALGGCYDVPDQNKASAKNYLEGAGGVASVMEIQLDDGTRCAVLIGGNKGAIDCDWRVIRVD